MDLIILLIIISIPTIAQVKVSSNYRKYKEIKNYEKLSGFEVARKILDQNGLDDVHIVETKGTLSDHYDPTYKVVRLSSDIFHGESVASLAVAAHEVGHAIQDKENYIFMRIRSMIFPFVNIATKFSYIIIMIGFIAQITNLIYIGIALISISLLFQLVTLPVEINASNRAKKELDSLKIANQEEYYGVSNMLSACAMTYVASILTAVLEIVRLILMARNNDR